MPTPTYDLIASYTASSNVTNITFSSIPQSYKNLVLVGNLKVTAGASYPGIRPNDDYNGISYVTMSNYGGSPYSEAASATGFQVGLSTYIYVNEIGLFQLYIFDYTSDKYKTAISRFSNSSRGVELTTNSWPVTSAITSLVVGGATWVTGSSLQLYGIVG